MKKIVYSGIILIVFLYACRKPERFSDIPEIKFISFEKLNQDEGRLAFYFQDGDGDIGLDNRDNYPPFDTSSIYRYNFFCDYYEKRNGIFQKIDSIINPKGELEPFNLNGRIPRLSNLPGESINGEIYYTFSPSYYDTFSPYSDTVKLKFYIVDRKLNHSNVEEIIIIR
ncbi:MAG: hypothetical protein FWC34_06970 [Bacteroidetes bacterium]|nr:hypothetical protein [Bacteroidota bacterium]MCL2302878.1 hypothetical protein [Lentimicrobiaceae bacterium]